MHSFGVTRICGGVPPLDDRRRTTAMTELVALCVTATSFVYGIITTVREWVRDFSSSMIYDIWKFVICMASKGESGGVSGGKLKMQMTQFYNDR